MAWKVLRFWQYLFFGWLYYFLNETSCARGDTIHPRPSPLRGRPSASRAAKQTQRSSKFPTPNTFSRSPLHLHHALRPRWLKRPGDLDLWPFDIEVVSESRVSHVYLCANFGLPRPLCSLCSRLRPDVRDRQTPDVRQKHHLMPPPIRGGA